MEVPASERRASGEGFAYLSCTYEVLTGTGPEVNMRDADDDGMKKTVLGVVEE